MSVKQKLNIKKKKNYDNFMILVDFCGNFPLFMLIFCYPDPFHEMDPNPDPTVQKENDPNGSGSETLLNIYFKMRYVFFIPCEL